MPLLSFTCLYMTANGVCLHLLVPPLSRPFSPCCHPSPVILLPHQPSPVPPLLLVIPLLSLFSLLLSLSCPSSLSPANLLPFTFFLPLPHHLQHYFLLSPYSSPPHLPLYPCPYVPLSITLPSPPTVHPSSFSQMSPPLPSRTSCSTARNFCASLRGSF